MFKRSLLAFLVLALTPLVICTLDVPTEAAPAPAARGARGAAPARGAGAARGGAAAAPASPGVPGPAGEPTPPADSEKTPPRAFLPSPSGFQTIHNDFFVVDQNGNRIATRSGCLCQFGKEFWWYGGGSRAMDQTCYVSTDLVHWTYKGVALRTAVDANRMDVLYNDTTKKYVMFLKYEGNSAYLGIATADKPEGPFTFKSQTLVDEVKIGDMSMFKDTDGTAYLAYVWWQTGPNREHGVYRMSPDYLTLDKRMYLWNIPSREAPMIMKRNNIYYYMTSRTAMITSTPTNYYTAANLAGPWTAPKLLSTPGSNNSWDTQCDFAFPIQGTQGTTYMFAGDRWIHTAARQGDYPWLPFEFDGDTPIVNYYQDWDINLTTGAWRKFDPARNLAAGKPATASSDSAPNVAKNVTAPKTYQDYINTRWESAPSDPQWIMVDLGTSQEINRVILKWHWDAAKDFKIQTSTDATAWTDVFTTTIGAPYTVTDEVIKPTTARYVRMYGTARAPQAAAGGRGALPASAPAAQAGYSLFDFMVLKD